MHLLYIHGCLRLKQRVLVYTRIKLTYDCMGELSNHWWSESFCSDEELETTLLLVDKVQSINDITGKKAKYIISFCSLPISVRLYKLKAKSDVNFCVVLLWKVTGSL